jgi:glycosyltransferase involved in cell wall biosynthesis
VPPENPTLLSQALLRLRGEEGKRKRMGERGRRFAVENLSRDAVGERYEELFENTLRSVRRGQ